LDLSWAAVIFIPTILTPAIIFYFMFRLLVPKAKSPPQNDAVSILLFVLLSCLVNIQLIGYLAEILWQAYIPPDKTPILSLFRNILGRNDYDPIRPFLFFYTKFVNNFLPTNVLGIFIDLHFRVVLIGVLLFILQWIFKSVKTFIDIKFYGKFPSNILNELANALLNPFKKFFFSYWNYVLDFDENLELLMIDISTNNDELYSGKFVDWTPDDDASKDSIGSIGITTVLKYEAKGTAEQQNCNCDNDNSEEMQKKQDKGYFYSKSSKRRWRLIQNDGTLYIPYSNIDTIHIWKIQRGSYFNVWVDNENKNERLKWHLMIISKSPDFIKQIKIKVKIDTQEKADNYLENLFSWIAENDLGNIAAKLHIDFYSQEKIVIKEDSNGN